MSARGAENARTRLRMNFADALHHGATVEELFTDLVAAIHGSSIPGGGEQRDIAQALLAEYRYVTRAVPDHRPRPTLPDPGRDPGGRVDQGLPVRLVGEHDE